MPKKIVALVNKYPNFIEPNVNVFTQQIVWCFADNGCICEVICPVAVNYNIKNILFPMERTERTDTGKTIKIYHPKYFGMGQRGSIALKTRVAMTTNSYIGAVEKVLRTMRRKDYVLFAEFLTPAGVAASLLGLKYGISSYMQFGDSIYAGDMQYGNKKLEKLLKGLNGVIALSGRNRDLLVDAGVVEREKIIVLPSGYRKNRFYPRDRIEARRKLNFPLDLFIVGFCGSFGDRKGILRLEKAIDAIDDDDICFAAVGKGKLDPTSKKCIFKGPMNHDELPWFYSAIDVFAFPTYHEGSCTAIVEAIACGCPVISSDRDFNYEICDDSNSILIEPDDIEAMKSSIIKLKNDTFLRFKLRDGSLKKSKSLSLEGKAKKVLDYMKVTCTDI